MREADRLTIEAGTPGVDLMERAGATVAEAAHRLAPDGSIAILCGPGNNGGDGFVAARLLADAGRDVALYLLGAREQLTGDAALAAERWPGPVKPLAQALDADPGLVVDALFGAGLSRPLDGVAADLAARPWRRVLSVDTPSGLDGDTGRAAGPVFTADATITFAAKKPAHVLADGAARCGLVDVADIGISDDTLADVSQSDVFENHPVLWSDRFPWPDRAAHKHRRGRLMCVTGGPSQTGAARLAARAGLRAGAGLVTLLSPRAATLVNAVHSTAIMVAPFEGPEDLAAKAERSHALVIGPAAGLSEATRAHVLALAAGPAGLIVDADGLTVFEDAPADLFNALGAGDVITPHAGEFERLFPGLLQSSRNRIDAVRTAAQTAGCVVLLKGPDTVIAHPAGHAVVNVHASPFLATAGSGDVLAGIIGGLCAQGMDAFHAAAAGAWLHGETGLALGPGLIAEDLPDTLPTALKRLYAERS